ncbi:glycosyltransferase family 2 protein [Vibrio ponticus]|uniref:Glycosyltransferase family 2 protein n=1 Tax=Vibrio ponticus TaxID=265668 RepID=A0A3N3DYY9_9VIBR|nr:glycosyltransferase family 2 protein [Vibrio ponticus]ROV59610.1 glycosyltransferase family 2 protein [Vibrio ponticus]
MMELALILLFSVSSFLIVYHHIGYPLLLKLVAKRTPLERKVSFKRLYRVTKADRSLPSITMLIPAYNEQEWIAQKIRNLSSLDYPKDKLKVIIACDGCTDSTVEIAEATIQEAICSETHFEIIQFEQNRGKVAVINQVMQGINSDITAMSDVSALVSFDALLLAAQHFQQSNAGVVNSRYQLLDSQNTGEMKYWQYQSMLQQGEANLGANIGAHGALYFFRTELFTPLALDTINDDFVIPMEIVRNGYQAIYEPNVVAVELENASLGKDFKRRLRISAGNMQQLLMLAELLRPRYKAVAFTFGSGKTLRLLTPYLLIICLVTSVALSYQTFFLAVLGLQVTFYTIAALGLLLPTIFTHRVIKLISYFTAGHFANLYGGLRYILGRETGRWERV